MNPLTSMEIKLCQAQAKIFENSVSKTNYSSLIFIRRFMYSTIAKSMDKRVYLYQSDSITDALNTINVFPLNIIYQVKMYINFLMAIK